MGVTQALMVIWLIVLTAGGIFVAEGVQRRNVLIVAGIVGLALVANAIPRKT